MSVEPIVVDQVYPSSPATVWSAITDPAEMRQWFFETITDFSAEVGFETEFEVDCEGRIYLHQWKVIEMVPQQRIAYDWKYAGISGESIVRWELTETPEGTKLTLTHSGGDSFPRDNPDFSRESCEGGWRYFLQQNLKGYLAK